MLLRQGVRGYRAGMDAALLAAACDAADGINGYTLEYDRDGSYLRRARDGLLRAGAERAIGWIRCDATTPSFHVQP